MAAHVCSLSPREAEVQGERGQGWHELHETLLQNKGRTKLKLAGHTGQLLSVFLGTKRV